jgi:intracellular septation protein A
MSNMTVHLPTPRSLLRSGVPQLLEATLVPAALFYLLLRLVGFKGALLAAFAWQLAAIVRHLVMHRRVPSVLLLTTGLVGARTLLGWFTGSAFLYFLQPTLGNFLIAFAFLATLPLSRPFIAKLADDFCAFPANFTGHPHVQRFFKRVSLLWALVFITNGVVTLFILATRAVGQFLLVSTAGTYSIVGVAILGSLFWFRRCLRGQGIVLRLGGAQAAAE